MAYARFGGTAADVSVKGSGAPYAGDALTVWDEVRAFGAAAVTAGDTTLTAAGGGFVAGDVGRLIVVEGAGAQGGLLRTTIASRTSGTEVELTAAASTTVTAAAVQVFDPVTDLKTWDGTAAQTSVTADDYGRVRFQAPDTYATLWADSGGGAMVVVRPTAGTVGSGSVDSVNGQTGTVVLDSDDIDDSGKTNQFATSAQLSKLDGIESGADVTDATNVASAGAVMASTATTKGDLLVRDTTGVTRLAVGMNDYVLTADSTQTTGLKWAAAAAGGVTSVNSETGAVTLTSDDISDTGQTHKWTSAAEISKLAGIEAAADVTDAANVAAAGAVMGTLADAKGDLIVATAADTVTRLAVGTNDYVLTADSTQATGVKWAAASGGSGIAATIFDAKGDLIAASAADTAARLAVGSNGQSLKARSTASTGLAWENHLGLVKPPAGEYVFNAVFGGSENTASAITSGTLYCVPLAVYAPMAIDRVAINIGTAGSAGAIIRLGLYALASTGVPGALLQDFGTLDATGTGDKTITVSYTIPIGLHLLVMVGNDSGIKPRWIGAGPQQQQLWWRGRTGPLAANGRYLTYTGYTASSALPDPATTSSETIQTGDCPLIAVRTA